MNKDLIINISVLLVSIFICTVLLFTVLEVRYFLKLDPYYRYDWKNPNTKFDSELGWSPILNRSIKCPAYWEEGTLSSNSHGFRSAEINPTKKAIIVIGDSVAFGAGINDNHTFSHFLDRMVFDKGYQVSNLAVSGYNLEQYYLFLKRHINKFKNIKHIVCVICTYNDLTGIGSNVLYGKRKPYFRINNHHQLILEGNNIKQYCLRNILSRSLFLSRFQPNQGLIGTFLSKIAGDKALDFNNAPDENGLLPCVMIQQIYNLARSHGAKLLIVLSPSREDFVKATIRFRWFQTIFKESISKNNELEIIDFISYIKKEDVDKVFNPNDIVHYSPEGHILLAKTVYEHLFENKK